MIFFVKTIYKCVYINYVYAICIWLIFVSKLKISFFYTSCHCVSLYTYILFYY